MNLARLTVLFNSIISYSMVGLSNKKPTPRLLQSLGQGPNSTKDIFTVPNTPKKTRISARPLNQQAAEEREVIVASDATNHDVVDDNNLNPVPHNIPSTTSSPATRQVAKRKRLGLPGDNLPKKQQKRQQIWKALDHRSRKRPARKPNQFRAAPEPLTNSVQLFKRQAVKADHSLHSQSTVQDIKDFLSNMSRIYGNESLFIHTEPIAYSSGNEKKQLKHLEQSQERDTFTNWTRRSFEGAIGAICLIGLYTTWIDTWVARTEKFQNEPLHVWAAVLMWHKGCHGKRLIIYDSNSDFLPEANVTEADLILGKQRGLIKHLREKEKYQITEIWVGGEGNTEEGKCLELTAKWIQEVAKAGGPDIDDLEKKGFRKVQKRSRLKNEAGLNHSTNLAYLKSYM